VVADTVPAVVDMAVLAPEQVALEREAQEQVAPEQVALERVAQERVATERVMLESVVVEPAGPITALGVLLTIVINTTVVGFTISYVNRNQI
jgi:hypothetical protein